MTVCSKNVKFVVYILLFKNVILRFFRFIYFEFVENFSTIYSSNNVPECVVHEIHSQMSLINVHLQTFSSLLLIMYIAKINRWLWNVLELSWFFRKKKYSWLRKKHFFVNYFLLLSRNRLQLFYSKMTLINLIQVCRFKQNFSKAKAKNKQIQKILFSFSIFRLN